MGHGGGDGGGGGVWGGGEEEGNGEVLDVVWGDGERAIRGRDFGRGIG